MAFSIALIGYKSITERRVFRISYWFLVVLLSGAFSLAFQAHIIPYIGAFIPYALYLVGASLLFLIIGIAHGMFRLSSSLYALVNTALIFGALLTSQLFVWRSSGGASVGMLLIAALMCGALIYEGLVWYGLSKKHAKFVAFALSVVIGELYLLLSFLPLGPFNTAAFLTLVAFFGRDIIVASHKGTLSVPFVLRSLTFFLLIAIIILSSSPWSI